MLRDAARKQELKEHLDSEVRAMQHLCRTDGMFAELVLPLRASPAPHARVSVADGARGSGEGRGTEDQGHGRHDASDALGLMCDDIAM